MNILCLHPVLSMRAVKEMAAVKESGHKVILVYEGIGSSASIDIGDFWEKIIRLPPSKNKLSFQLRRVFPVFYKSVLRKIIQEANIDLIHVFSMPDHLAVASIKYASVPVIYDIRDLTTGMNKIPFFTTKLSALDKFQKDFHRIIQKRFEKFAVIHSNGVICVAEAMADKVIELYNISRKKVTFLESYPLKKNIPQTISEKLSKDGGIHLVYAGNLFFDGYENSVSFIKQIADRGLYIHIYPTGEKYEIDLVKKKYRNNQFIHFHEPVKAIDLFLELTKYDYGLVLYSPRNDQLNRSLTISNKLLEYLACGIPVASTDLEAPRRFLDKHNAGFVFVNATDLSKKAEEFKNTFSIKRHHFIMENHIFKLLKLYENLE